MATHHHHHPTTTPPGGTKTHEERALYEEAAHVTKRIRVLHPKTSPAGYCAPLGASIRFVSDFSAVQREGTKEQRKTRSKGAYEYL